MDEKLRKLERALASGDRSAAPKICRVSGHDRGDGGQVFLEVDESGVVQRPAFRCSRCSRLVPLPGSVYSG